jgi:ABC-type Na+ efflux pump permease subunit
MNQIKIALLELKRIARDTNWTISQMILPLIIYPLIYIFAPVLISKIVGNPQQLGGHIAISGNFSQIFVDKLTSRGFEVSPVIDALIVVNNREADVGIVGIRNLVDADELGEMRLYLKGSRLASSLTAQKLQTALRDITIELIAEKANISTAKIQTLTPVFVNVDTPLEASGGGFSFLFVTLLLSLIALQSGTIGTEITATAHERGEFTSQLATPVRNYEFILTRLLTSTVAVAILMFWNLFIYQVVGMVRPLILQNGFIAERAINFGNGGFVNMQVFTGTVLLSISNLLMYSSIAITIGILFRSAKTSNNLYGPVSILSSIVTFIAPFSDNFVTLSDSVFYIPIISGAVAQIRLLVNTLPWYSAMSTIVVQALLTIVMVVLASQQLRQKHF